MALMVAAELELKSGLYMNDPDEMMSNNWVGWYLDMEAVERRKYLGLIRKKYGADMVATFKAACREYDAERAENDAELEERVSRRKVVDGKVIRPDDEP
jgi:hypothetical protein